MNFRYFLLLSFITTLCQLGHSQSTNVLSLDLSDAIRLANDSSLASYISKSCYLSSYWEYRSYSASKLPQIQLNTVPLNYNRALVKRYNSQLNIDEYREEQSLSSYVNATISQNLPLTGGTFFIDSEINFLNNFGKDGYTQFRTVPIRVGYEQKLFGFNSYKWNKSIEPLKYEKSRLELIRSVETINKQLVDYYFMRIMAEKRRELALVNLANADTLYNIGLKRLAIASIAQSDVLTLKVDVMNAQNDLQEANKQLAKSQFIFNSFLRLPETLGVDLATPDSISDIKIDAKQALDIAYENDPDLLSYKQQRLEAQMHLEKTRRDNRFNATLSASFGYNQQADQFSNSYIKPLDQQQVMVGFSIPLVDWGQRKGQYLMAKKNLEVVNLSCEQLEVDFRQKIIIAVADFNAQYDIVQSLFMTLDVAKKAYETTKQRFLLGKVDVNTLSLVLKRQDEAYINYLNSLYNYWKYYFTIRESTLYDFIGNKTLNTQNISAIQ